MSKRSKQLKTTKTIKLQWIASIWRHNDKKCWVTSQCIQNNAKLQKWSYNDEFASISCQNDQNNSKQLKLKNDQITMNCIDLTSKRSKILSYVAKHSKQRKTTKVIKIQLLASIRRRKDKKCRVKSQNIKTTPNYESDQIIMNCIDLTS